MWRWTVGSSVMRMSGAMRIRGLSYFLRRPWWMAAERPVKAVRPSQSVEMDARGGPGNLRRRYQAIKLEMMK